jgi:hypothetical protein
VALLVSACFIHEERLALQINMSDLNMIRPVQWLIRKGKSSYKIGSMCEFLLYSVFCARLLWNLLTKFSRTLRNSQFLYGKLLRFNLATGKNVKT